MRYWTLTKRGKIWQNIAFSRHVSFHAEASALAALQSQDKGFPHPAPKGTKLAASPSLICLRHWKPKWREKKQLEFEEAALEVCNLHWRAQWRWQRVLPVSLSYVIGVLWALLAAKDSRSLKKGVLQVWAAGRCCRAHPNGSLPIGKSPQITPWGRHLVSSGATSLVREESASESGAGGHSLPYSTPGKNATPTSTPWPESSLSPGKAERIGVAASPKFR